MIIETLFAIFAVIFGAVAFCFALVVAAKCWYYSWYAITFILLFIHEKGNYSLAQHNLLTKS